MLKGKEAVATVAVKDVGAARRFYEETLGLERVETGEEGVLGFRSGGSSLMVYASEFAGTNQATSVTWMVGGEVDEIARTLAGEGVRFERYDMPGMTLDGDVHVSDGMRVAWFKDPDGNIHSLVSG